VTQALTVAVRPRKRAALLRRWRYHAWGIVLVPLAPVLLPALGLRVAFETWGRALDWPTPERRRFWVRLWWWYGYHGLYQLDWRMKHRSVVARARAAVAGIAEVTDPDDWFAE
jgi:hypothetical protein